VLGGLAGCACIATGFIFFVEKRKRQHAKQGTSGARWVDACAVATVTGLLVATFGMLIGNRLLPDNLPLRGSWEKGIFLGAWLLALAHGIWRTAPTAEGRLSPAWAEQCWAVAVLAVAAVLLNWVTTGDHLLRTLGAGYWPVAGVDLSLLASAALAVMAARVLKRRAAAAVTAAPARAASDNNTSAARA
jgi:hypothetical protein